MIRLYAYAGIALVILLTATWAYNAVWQRGYDTAHAEVTAVLNEERAAVQAERDASEAKARATEQAHRDAMNAAAVQYEKDKADGERKANAVVADLRAGNLRLQRRFQCPANPGIGLPGTSDPAGIGDGAAQGGFTREDAEVALGIAREGDRAIEQLTACQTILRSSATISR